MNEIKWKDVSADYACEKWMAWIPRWNVTLYVLEAPHSMAHWRAFWGFLPPNRDFYTEKSLTSGGVASDGEVSTAKILAKEWLAEEVRQASLELEALK